MLNLQIQSDDSMTFNDFQDRLWEDLVDRISAIFHLEPERKARVMDNRSIKLTAAIPFIAGCRNPMRTALAHMSVFMTAASEGGKDIFAHNFSDNDDLFTRLERISHYDGGSEILIGRGMNLLALAMLEDHRSDAREDGLEGKYNPLNEGVWNYEGLSQTLRELIAAIPCPAMDAIISVDKVPGYWDA